MTQDAGPREIYFEFAIQGAYVKVTAIEHADGLEASIVGPRGTPQADLERLALRKLDFIRESRKSEPRRPGKGVLA